MVFISKWSVTFIIVLIIFFIYIATMLMNPYCTNKAAQQLICNTTVYIILKGD